MIQGSIVALITPFDNNNKIDLHAVERLVDFHLQQKTDGIVVAGTTGESATMSSVEHIGLIQKVVQLVAGQVPVIAGTGSNSTQEAIELTRSAKEAGANACLLISPYYNKPTQQGIIRHYTAIADAVEIPQILYNVPARTASTIAIDSIVELSKHPNIIGLKEALADLDRVKTLLEETDKNFAIYSGDDETALQAMNLGAAGVISVTANIAPLLMHEMCQAALNNKAKQAEQMNEKLMPLHKDLFIESNPIPVKWAVAKLGLIGEHIRLPLTELSPQYHQTILSAMQGADAI